MIKPNVRIKEPWGWVLAHFGIAAFFFSNFFLFGQILVASTDMLIINFPMLMLAKRSFLQGEIPLWNPYVMGGASNFLCGVAPFFSPENWIHFLVPEKYFFQVATFLQFLRLGLVGTFAFFLFFEELGNRRWAFFAAACYQLSGYTLWTTTAYDTLSLLMYFTWALALLWTASHRPLYRQYFYLTAVCALMVLSSNVAYGPYALLILPVFFLYRTFGGHKGLWVGTLSLATAGLLIMIRFLPAWAELQHANRVAKVWEVDVQSLDVLGLRLLVPEIFAVAYARSRDILTGIVPHHPDLHIHWAMPHFFGVLPFCLLVWAIFSRQEKRTWFWIGYVLVSLSLILYIPPFDTFARLLSFPAYHAFSLQIFLPIGVSVLAAYAGMRLESRPLSFYREEKARASFFVVLGSALLFAALIWISRYRFTEPMGALKVIGLGTFVGLVGFFFGLERISLEKVRPIFFPLACVLLLVSVGVISSNLTFLSHLKLILVSLATMLMFFSGRMRREKTLFFAISLLIALWPWATRVHELPDPREDLILAGLGVFKALVVVAIFSLALRSKKAVVYPLCLGLLLLDQLPAMKIHSHIALNPFFAASTPYPERKAAEARLDLVNYRVNRPHLMLHLPIYEALWGKTEIISSLASVYGIRSFGGYFNAISERYGRFADAFNLRYAFGGMPTETEDNRFLDLMGVRYNYEPTTSQVEIRPNALARVTWFSDYQVAKDERALEILRAKDFKPRGQLIVAEAPEFAAESGEARSVSILRETSNRVTVDLASSTPGLLLLDDSYHSGWTAYIDGKAQRVYPADYALMATSVPAGRHHVEFRFEPIFFRLGLQLTWVGLGLWLGLSFLFWLGSEKVPIYFSAEKVAGI
jgi:hypothetical protein